MDGVYPVLLQDVIKLLIGSLTNMFRPFLALGHVPEVWKIVRAVFIPKVRRPSHVGVKDYRPISLTSFVLKTMETCIDWFIKDEVLRRNPFHSNQYAYKEGVSTETSLHAFLSRIEAQLEKRNYAVAIFMDFEGSFSHTSPHIICEEAASRGAPRPIVDWMMGLLGTRRITSTLGSYRCSGTGSMGNPQGRVTLSLDWNLVANGLLRFLNGGGCYAQAYVDNFAIVTGCSYLCAAVHLMQCMLRNVSTWCTETGLKVNPDKIQGSDLHTSG